jgi:pimeloyl-ACP methyl ester carboxylesterase
MNLPRRRDNQQWILDYLIKTTGRAQTFEPDTRMLPAEVRSHVMISKIVGQRALRSEQLARDAEAAGHLHVALTAYADAIRSYVDAQHSIFDPERFDEKRYWFDRAIACNTRVRALSPHPIERIEVPWETASMPAHLHLQPERKQGPTILFIPGMDGTKETSGIGPLAEVFMPHGVHVFSMDGPGQGESTLRGLHITDDNYERAISAALDLLLELPEVDPERIAVIGRSFGSLWALRAAARDPRVKAVAVDAVCFGDKRAIFERASPRFKQIFMMMAGEDDEARFDRMAERMVILGHGSRIMCPTLISAGEFDPLTNLLEVEAVFEELAGPKELWILEDQFHSYRDVPGLLGIDNLHFMLDWILDALDGRFDVDHRRVTLVAKGGAGPYRDHAPFRPWQEDGDKTAAIADE